MCAIAAAGGAQGSDAVGSEAGVMRAGCRTGRTGVGDRADLAGGNGGSWGKPGASGIFNRADDSRASSAARDSVRAGTGGWGDKGVMGAAGGRDDSGAEGTGSGGNEAGRGDCIWASSCCGYRLWIAILKSFQAFGSSNASRVAAHVSHDPSSTS